MGHWSTDKAEREFLQLYDSLRAERFEALCAQGWSGPPEAADVETRFGSTRVYQWRGSGVPILLLPGAGASSLMWVPLVGELVGLPVYALDTIGDAGRSVQRSPMPHREDLAIWLDDVLDGLGLERVHLVGASYGGWVALAFARHAPQRVVKLTLLEPVLDKLRPWFWIHGLACGVALLMPPPVRRAAARMLHTNVLAVDDKRILRFGFLAQAKYRRGLPKFVPVADDELASIQAPTLVLLGQKSPVHRSRALLARLRAVAPDFETEVVAGAGHSLPVDEPIIAAARLKAFRGHQTGASEPL